jgi:hypothetical protein
MTTPKKNFLFTSTLSADAPAKTKKAKDFDSTKNFFHLTTPPEHRRPRQAKNYIAEKKTTQTKEHVDRLPCENHTPIDQQNGNLKTGEPNEETKKDPMN